MENKDYTKMTYEELLEEYGRLREERENAWNHPARDYLIEAQYNIASRKADEVLKRMCELKGINPQIILGGEEK